ncbi:hypothetical protein Emag_007270 [Eimeria magna]
MVTSRPSLGHWDEQHVNALVEFISPASSHLLEVGGFPAPSGRLHPLRRKGSLRAALAIALFILSTAVLLSLCKRAFGTLAQAGARYRKLAEGGAEGDSSDGELQAILEQCIAYETENGFPSTSYVPAYTEPLDEDMRKAQWALYLKEAALSFEKSEQHPAPDLGRRITASYLPPERPPPSIFKSSEYPIGVKEAVMPQTSAESVVSGMQQPTFSGNGSALPELGEESWLTQVPDILQEARQVPNAAPAGSRTVLSVANQPPRSDTLSKLLATPTPMSRGAGPSTHPFFRLPRVLPGAVRRTFNAELPVSPSVPWYSLVSLLDKARKIYAKPSLNTDEVEDLMITLETLANITLRRTVGEISAAKAMHLVARQVGQAFMIMDALVSGIQILGPHMVPGKWWFRIADHYTTDYTLPPVPKSVPPGYWGNRLAIERILPAMKTLITGVRPPAKDIVELKQLLLCFQHSPSFFREPRWDPWRADNARFLGVSVESFERGAHSQHDK